MIRVATAAMLLFLVACGCPPLAGVEVQGANARIVNAVQDSLDRFADESSVKVCISSVAVKDVARGDGRYNSVSRGIRVDPDTVDPGLVTTHELCHASDLQLGLVAGDDPFDQAGGRREQREAFAVVCEEGGRALAIVADVACPEDATQSADVAFVRNTVFSAVADTSAWSLWDPAVSWQLPSELGANPALQAAEIDADGRLAVWVSGDGNVAKRALDPSTGEELEALPLYDFAQPQDVSAPAGWATWSGASSGAVSVALARWLQGDQRARLLHRVDGTYHVLEYCPAGGELAFVWGSDVGVVGVDSGALIWGPVLLSDGAY